MKTYITGASGKLGRHVLRFMEAVPLVRSPKGLPGEVVTDFSAESLKKILKDADCIIHLAGSMRFWDAAEMRQTNVGLTRSIVDNSPEGCKIVLASSISVYGKRLAEIPADEATHTHPDSPYSRSKMEAEEIVRRKKGKHAILRIGTIYGPEFGDYFHILRMLEKGKMSIIGDGKNHVPFVHVEDAARAVAAAVGNGQGAYVVCGESKTQMEIYALACKELGVAPPKKHISFWMANLMGRMQEVGARFGMKPKLTGEHMSILGEDRVFRWERAGRELGFKPRGIEEGIREMVKEYRKERMARVPVLRSSSPPRSP
ncbi:MAG: NAD-dependent epimerase/dehydratase family protein [Candidatus ainarchaeum sp.]|nr:NAD-dependent epimerase/dehydratase family protein [Candidatus ainarchaeum sp.]